MAQSSAVLVTGASGQLGGQVATTLLDRGARVIAATRSPERLAHLSQRGAEIRRLDLDDPSTLEAAFLGIDRALLVSTDDLETPGKRLRQHSAAIAAAEKAGVRHLVYTSAPSPAPGLALLDDHFWTEQTLAASRLGWTILRNSLYADLLLGSLPQAIATGVYAAATGPGARNYVTRSDAARAAAGALLDGFEGRRLLDVTGPEALTGADIASIASDITGKPVTFAAIEPDALRAGLTGAGLPPGLVAALVQFDVDASEGRHTVTTEAVRALSGQAPQSVRGFLESHRSALTGGALF